MASIVKRRLKDKTIALYGKIKRGGEWIQFATNQPTKVLALRWAALRCECAACARGRNHAPALPVDPEPTAPPEPAPSKPMCGELMDTWAASITNRAAGKDRSRLKLYVRPGFAHLLPEAVTLAIVMKWIDELRKPRPVVEGKTPGRRRESADGRLSDATIRGALNVLSRFFSWCIERGHATANPVRLIPVRKRPHDTAKAKDRPWIKDDKTVRDAMGALASPFREMFYLGNRSGLRNGEQRGLRMSDMAFLGEGVFRVRYSDDGPLKEDKEGKGELVKWVPAPDDVEAVLGPWLARRRAEGAEAEDYVFAPDLTRVAVKQRAEAAWREAADALALDVSYYEATRHSFASRNLAAGASLDEVSQALGHASPATTQRYYNHFVRKSFSPVLRTGIGAKPATQEGGKTLSFPKPATAG